MNKIKREHLIENINGGIFHRDIKRSEMRNEKKERNKIWMKFKKVKKKQKKTNLKRMKSEKNDIIQRKNKFIAFDKFFFIYEVKI